jgi:branched-chain amino acid transport system substrate-binding protein
MGMKGRVLALVAGAALAAGVAATAAFGAHRADPGITVSSITIGGTFPLTGVASLYGAIPVAENAYFQYVNDHGGVNGRKIDFKFLDDSYDSSKTVPLTQQLVEQDHVFAIVGSLGTVEGLSTWGYLNDRHIPQLMLATGDSFWGFCAHRACMGGPKPWTTGWQPDYPGEGKLYGRYIAQNMPNAKIGVLYQDDAFGKNYYSGLRIGLGSHKSQIVDAESYDQTNPSVTQQILALKAKGADTLVIFAIPTQAIGALVTATKVGWSPQEFLGNVSANRLFMLRAAQLGANVDGVISTSYVASNTAQPDLPGVKLADQIIGQYGTPSIQGTYKLGDANIMYGLGVAWTFVYALQHAGKNPTRASLMKAMHSLNTSKDPFLYPGIKLQTSAKDNFPIEQEILIKWSGGPGGDFHAFGKLQGGIR